LCHRNQSKNALASIINFLFAEAFSSGSTAAYHIDHELLRIYPLQVYRCYLLKNNGKEIQLKLHEKGFLFITG